MVSVVRFYGNKGVLMICCISCSILPSQCNKSKKRKFQAVSCSRFNSILETAICFGLSIATLLATSKSAGVPWCICCLWATSDLADLLMTKISAFGCWQIWTCKFKLFLIFFFQLRISILSCIISIYTSGFNFFLAVKFSLFFPTLNSCHLVFSPFFF